MKSELNFLEGYFYLFWILERDYNSHYSPRVQERNIVFDLANLVMDLENEMKMFTKLHEPRQMLGGVLVCAAMGDNNEQPIKFSLYTIFYRFLFKT